MSIHAIITGATGFIGSTLTKEILNNGGSVVAITRHNSLNLMRLPQHPNLTIINSGIIDNTLLDKLSKQNVSYDAFYHLAWEGVGNSDRNSISQFNNLGPTLESIKLASSLGCRSWIGTGSQAEYGNLNKSIEENDLESPTTLYGAAKLSACIASQILGRQLKINTKWVRVFSTYGPGDNSGWMLTDLIRQLLQHKQPKLTKGEQIWDYLYVEDAARALLALGSIHEDTTGIYNLGSGTSLPIREIVEMVRDIIDPSFQLVFGEMPYRLDQVMHLEANIDKLHRLTNWKAHIDLKQGLTNTVAYIQRNI